LKISRWSCNRVKQSHTAETCETVTSNKKSDTDLSIKPNIIIIIIIIRLSSSSTLFPLGSKIREQQPLLRAAASLLTTHYFFTVGSETMFWEFFMDNGAAVGIMSADKKKGKKWKKMQQRIKTAVSVSRTSDCFSSSFPQNLRRPFLSGLMPVRSFPLSSGRLWRDARGTCRTDRPLNSS